MIVLGLLLVLSFIGAPLFVIVGMVTAACFAIYTDRVVMFSDFAWVIEPLEEMLGKDQFLAIPLFIASGAIMTHGGLARRLVDVARACFGWLPGGLGITAVVSCMFFAAISGSSPVTLIAVGSIMFPAMVASRYPENFSLGLVMTAGSLGCLVPPALVLVIYSIAVMGGKGSVDPSDMFVAASVPAIGIALILMVYCFLVGLRIPGERQKFSFAEIKKAIREGIWALLLPVIVIGGILTGMFPPFKAGGVAVAYSLIVTVFIHREMGPSKVISVLADAGKLMGMLILVIGLAFGLNKFLDLINVDEKFIQLIKDWDLGPVGFMMLTNLVLVVLGALMDSISATLIFAPILAPIAVEHYGIDPLHFGVVFVVNMEIGYLAPPVATNLFVASALFKKPFGQVCRAILPGLAITCAALVMFMYVPTCSKGLTNFQRDQPVWESFPWDGKPAEQNIAGDGAGLEAILKKHSIENKPDQDAGAATPGVDAGAGSGSPAPAADAGSGDELEGIQL